MSTWVEILTDAYSEVGANPIGENLSGEKLEEGRRNLNRMLGLWRIQKRFAVYLQTVTYPLTTATSYTLGPASETPDFELLGSTDTRPAMIWRANLREGTASPYIYTPLSVNLMEQFADDPYRESGFINPYSVNYKPTFPNGTIYLSPDICLVGNYLELWFESQLVSVAEDELADDASLSDGYEDAIVMSLAERLLTLYPGRSTESEIIRRAREARSIIQGVNSPPPIMDLR